MIINLWWRQYTNHDLLTVTPPSFQHNSRPRRMKYAWRGSGCTLACWGEGWGGVRMSEEEQGKRFFSRSLVAWVVLHLNLLNNKLFIDLIPKTVVKNISGNKQKLGCFATGVVSSISLISSLPLYLFFELYQMSLSLINLHAFQNSLRYRDDWFIWLFQGIDSWQLCHASNHRHSWHTRSSFLAACCIVCCSFDFWFSFLSLCFVLFSAAAHRMGITKKQIKQKCVYQIYL